MGHRLFQARNGELLERVAASLGELGALYEGADERQSALDEAVAGGGLVLAISERKAYWEGKEIPADWSRHQSGWRFLKALVEKGRYGIPVEPRDVYGVVAVAFSTLPTVLSRLKRIVPPSLWKRIVPSREPKGGYRLNLERERIFLH
jgi:hypothetical protein